MSPSLWQILVVVILLVLLFGRGKISALMGDVAKGIKSFKKGMADDDEDMVETQSASSRVDRRGSETIDVTPEAERDRA
ncbi:MAG TPA: twin-arginine translocase TatA/TatE family subunit [Paracoccaceae bacterium]|nr:twin-arginine translocase TatA/TatE family subunit [Paracoccaceae bacterium]